MNFSITPWEVYHIPNLITVDHTLLPVLISLSKAQGYCFATTETLSTIINQSERTIKRSLARLEKEGLIKREKDPQLKDGEWSSQRRIYVTWKQGQNTTPQQKVHPEQVTQATIRPEQVDSKPLADESVQPELTSQPEIPTISDTDFIDYIFDKMKFKVDPKDTPQVLDILRTLNAADSNAFRYSILTRQLSFRNIEFEDLQHKTELRASP